MFNTNFIILNAKIEPDKLVPGEVHGFEVCNRRPDRSGRELGDLIAVELEHAEVRAVLELVRQRRQRVVREDQRVEL